MQDSCIASSRLQPARLRELARPAKDLASDRSQSFLAECRTNADEIAASLLGLGNMGEQATDLRGRLVEANEALQGAGQSLLSRLTELRELSRAQQAISDTRKVCIHRPGHEDPRYIKHKIECSSPSKGATRQAVQGGSCCRSAPFCCGLLTGANLTCHSDSLVLTEA